MVNLSIYVDDNCGNCAEARKIAEQVRSCYPQVSVSVLDLTRPEVDKPEQVFAVPTYLLNGETLFLGNPTEKELHGLLEATLA